jgi:hypothetical protein
VPAAETDTGHQVAYFAMRIAAGLMVAVYAGFVLGELPPPTDEAKTRAAEAAAKGAWNDKVAAYQTCLAIDRTADAYRRSRKDAGQDIPTPVATGPCTDPGPYVSPVTPTASKPLEAAGAHSPPETATSPPSTTATAREVSGDGKK